MVDRDQLFDELNVRGSRDESNADLAPILTLMENVLEHGEVHAEFSDDSERYVEIRKGTTTFDFEGGVFVIDDGTTEHRFSMRGLSNWHKPRNVFESSSQ